MNIFYSVRKSADSLGWLLLLLLLTSATVIAAPKSTILAQVKKLTYEQLQAKVATLSQEKKLFSKEGEVHVEYLALTHEKKRNYDKAQSEFLRLWSIRKVLYGNDKAVTLHSLYCLARCYTYDSKTHETALTLLNRIIGKAQNARSDFVQKIKGGSYDKLAHIYTCRGRFEEAAKAKQKALDIYATIRSSEETLGMSFINAVPLFARVDLEQAKTAFLKGIATLEKKQKGRASFLARYYAYSYADFSKKEVHWKWLNKAVLEVPEKEKKEHAKALHFVKKSSQKLGNVLKGLRLGTSAEGRSSPEEKDEFGKSALLDACELGNVEIIERLLNEGAKVNDCDRLQRGPLHYVAKGLYLDMFRNGYLKKLKRAPLNIDRLAINELLIKRGIEPAPRDLLENLPLHFVSYDMDGKFAEELINRAKDINAKNKLLRTALHYAARDGNEKVVRLLLAKNTNFQLRDIVGLTPLQLAAINGHKGICHLLRAHAKQQEMKDTK